MQLKHLVCLLLEYLLGLEIRGGGPRRVSCRKPSCYGEDIGKDEKYKTCRYHREQKRSIHALFFLKKSHLWFAPTRKATKTNVMSISFSCQFWQKETASQTALPQQCQCCSSWDTWWTGSCNWSQFKMTSNSRKRIFLSQISPQAHSLTER